MAVFEFTARFMPGENVPGFAATQVNGGRFLKVTADKTADGDYTIGHCGLGERSCGVSQYDSGPTTRSAHAVSRRVNMIRRGAVARVAPGAAIAVGALVMSDANGKAVTFDATGAHVALGQAMHAIASTDDFGEIDLF